MTEQIRDFGQKDGGIIGPSALHGVAHVRPDEERIMAKDALIFGVNVGRVGEGQNMDDLHVTQFRGPPGQPVYQANRYAGPAAQIDPVAGIDSSQGRIHISYFLAVD